MFSENFLQFIIDLFSGKNPVLTTAVIASIIPVVSGIATLIIKALKNLFTFLQQRKLTDKLNPFYTFDEVKNYTQYYIQAYFQNEPPSEREEPADSVVARNLIIPFFLKRAFVEGRDKTKFYMILADSGMGKTAFLINLYRYYTKKLFGKKYKIKLLPLAYPDVDKEIDKIEDSEIKDTILLLDALDEDMKAVHNFEKRLDAIVSRVWKFREVVITCRSQFLTTKKQREYEIKIRKYTGMGYHKFTRMFLSPFDNRQVKKYLNKQFGIGLFNRKKKKKAKIVVEKSPNLMVRPMLLRSIEDLIKKEESYDYTFQIYEEMVKWWIERESNKYEPDEKDKFKVELEKFTTEIAVFIYKNRVKKNGELIIDKKDIELFAKKHKVKLEEWQLTGRSLLNCNMKGQFKFAHKSILEYFLAKEIYKNLKFKEEFSFEGMEQTNKFLREFIIAAVKRVKGKYSTVEGKSAKTDLSEIKEEEIFHITWLSFDNEILDDIGFLNHLEKLEGVKFNKNKITDYRTLKNIKRKFRKFLYGINIEKANLCKADLSNADLSGVNLSGANLSGVNFSSANLHGANLYGVNLSEANLNKANLCEANINNATLDKTNLTQASLIDIDLNNVNLTNAILLKVNLTGANLSGNDFSGVNFHGANLSEANLSEANLSKANLSEVNLNEANLTNTILLKANLSEANLNKANLKGANLNNTILNKTILSETIFIGINLDKVNLTSAILTKVNLSCTDLSGKDLKGIDFSEANLSGANLSGTNLSGANLSGADLSKAIITKKQLRSCASYKGAKLDPKLLE